MNKTTIYKHKKAKHKSLTTYRWQQAGLTDDAHVSVTICYEKGESTLELHVMKWMKEASNLNKLLGDSPHGNSNKEIIRFITLIWRGFLSACMCAALFHFRLLLFLFQRELHFRLPRCRFILICDEQRSKTLLFMTVICTYIIFIELCIWNIYFLLVISRFLFMVLLYIIIYITT